MKARIISRHVSRIEDGVRKGYGEIVEITKEELATGAYAPFKDNRKRKKNAKVVSKKNVQLPSDAKDGDSKK